MYPTSTVVNYEQAVEPFRMTDRLSVTERAMLMGGLRQGLRLVAEGEDRLISAASTIRFARQGEARKVRAYSGRLPESRTQGSLHHWL